MNSLSEANTHFALDLFQQFKKSEKDNIFYSPLSITSALAMMYLGAQGNTALQMGKVLHFNEVADNARERPTTAHAEKLGNVHHQFQKLLTGLKKSTDAYELSIANRLYGEKKFQFRQEYMENVKKFYLASVESADFKNAAEENRKKINSWVESQTNGKIKDVFPPHSLESAILVLVNAVYFKGQWDEKFDKRRTVEEKFWLNKDTSKSVQMMKQKSFFNFTDLEDMQAKILEIPYKGKDLSMMLLLPNEVDGLQKLEGKLTAEKLIEWTSSQNMREKEVDLYLPRFKVEESYNLEEVLMSMGMVDAFSTREANFLGIAESKGLVLTKVVHKSFVEVNEEGTEAAAATGGVVGITSLPIYESFHCDHPFLFFIKHNKTNSILFLGRISSP
ncbi:serpin B3-like [Equus przewalskii]|uniref:Serpin domain-containing protein n=2 Tax=Equus TaxID=9789 RepID=A0A3Q2HT63_HORSE|nr:serpin B3 [Equus caballus]XP_008507434.1 PREDICTED: serpin B3-like [Equus przewalskii]